MYVTDKEFTFIFDEVLKDSRPKYCQKNLLTFKAYRECINNELCPIKILIKLSRYKINKIIRSADIAGLNIKTNCTKGNTFKRYYFKKIQKNYRTDQSYFSMELLDNIV